MVRYLFLLSILFLSPLGVFAFDFDVSGSSACGGSMYSTYVYNWEAGDDDFVHSGVQFIASSTSVITSFQIEAYISSSTRSAVPATLRVYALDGDRADGMFDGYAGGGDLSLVNYSNTFTLYDTGVLPDDLVTVSFTPALSLSADVPYAFVIMPDSWLSGETFGVGLCGLSSSYSGASSNVIDMAYHPGILDPTITTAGSFSPEGDDVTAADSQTFLKIRSFNTAVAYDLALTGVSLANTASGTVSSVPVIGSAAACTAFSYSWEASHCGTTSDGDGLIFDLALADGISSDDYYLETYLLDIDNDIYKGMSYYQRSYTEFDVSYSDMFALGTHDVPLFLVYRACLVPYDVASSTSVCVLAQLVVGGSEDDFWTGLSQYNQNDGTGSLEDPTWLSNELTELWGTYKYLVPWGYITRTYDEYLLQQNASTSALVIPLDMSRFGLPATSAQFDLTAWASVDRWKNDPDYAGIAAGLEAFDKFMYGLLAMFLLYRVWSGAWHHGLEAGVARRKADILRANDYSRADYFNNR